MEQGNLGDVKPVGEGVFETKLDFGPGYRIYFAREGTDIILLLGGGTKRRQSRDIEKAIGRWRDYRHRKSEDSS